jgi:hypothetical protein
VATIASNKIDAKKNDAIAPPISAFPSPFSRVCHLHFIPPFFFIGDRTHNFAFFILQ